MATTRIKICGITRLEDALAVAEAGADALGFVFYPGSPRNLGIAEAAAIIEALPPFLTTVGVFVNPTEEQVRATFSACRLDAVQLHGDESPEFCARLGVPVIKGFRIRSRESLGAMSAYPVRAWLLDAFVEGTLGGTGRTFSWDLAVAAKDFGRPIVLAGGLHPGNVADAVDRVRPYAVDVSSSVELSPGRKDPEKVRALVREVRRADAL